MLIFLSCCRETHKQTYHGDLKKTPHSRYKYATGRELEKAREAAYGGEELSDKEFDTFSKLLRGLTNRWVDGLVDGHSIIIHSVRTGCLVVRLVCLSRVKA